MKCNIITNLNGCGLQREFEILRAEFEKLGHEVHSVQFNVQNPKIQKVDINIFSEILVPEMFKYAKENWSLPNIEWWTDKHTELLPKLDMVFVKTHDALARMQPIAGDKVHFLPSKARDLLDTSVEKERTFLHVAGNSSVKNTEQVLEAIAAVPEAKLTLVTHHSSFRKKADKIPNVQTLSKISDDALKNLMNKTWFHLCPSKYEGYGHTIHEGLSVGSVVFVTDAPPTDELGLPKVCLIPATQEGMLRIAPLFTVTADAIKEKIHWALGLTNEELVRYGLFNRKRYESEVEEFTKEIAELLSVW